MKQELPRSNVVLATARSADRRSLQDEAEGSLHNERHRGFPQFR